MRIRIAWAHGGNGMKLLEFGGRVAMYFVVSRLFKLFPALVR